MSQAQRRFKAFREVDQAKVRYLFDDEVIRLVNACEPDFRNLVTAALLTGCRYGEVVAMRASDHDRQAGTVTIGQSKGGKVRHVVLTDEGCAFLQSRTAGRRPVLCSFSATCACSKPVDASVA